MKNLCVFCGSSLGARAIYAQVATELGTLLAQEEIGVVYGGARVGLMGIVADSALAGGGKVYGYLPGFLANRELSHRGLTELVVVGSMHERKAEMAERADGFIALPGGFGTFEEIFEMLTWTQLGVHQKPCALLNIDGYFDPLRAQLDRAVLDGFLRPEHRDMVVTESAVKNLLPRLRAWRPVTYAKWVDSSKT